MTSAKTNGGSSDDGAKTNGGKADKRSVDLRHTYSFQSTLPRLPIPTLEATMEKFPRVLSALQDEAQREDTKRIAEVFLRGDGPKLQALLEAYEEEGRLSGKFGSYVEEFWSEAYLAPNSSVVLNLNPFFLLEDGPDAKKANDQVLRAASLAFASIRLASMLKHESLHPDVFRGVPLCMDQFKVLFGSCRLPEKEKQDCVSVDPDSTHVVVLHKNQFYYFQALWPDGTVAVDESDIKEILQAIKVDASKTDPEVAGKNSLGVLTTLPRKTWAISRDNLVTHSSHNNSALQIIDTALFVLVLDDFIPRDIHEAASNMLHGSYKLESGKELAYYQAGTCCNRWYDKLQIIVCGDGSAGINFEHSAVDGHTALRFVSDIFAETVVSFAQSITKLIYGKGRIPSVIQADVRRASSLCDEVGKPIFDTSPKRLEFELPQSVLDNIFFAETSLGDQIVASDTCVLEFMRYGKSLITANKMSPDSFVQMSMLLAYFRLYGKVVCMYEPVLTKQFYHGRTEAMRTATPQAAEFCQLWISTFSTDEEKLNGLRLATAEHSAQVKQCAAGFGVDRHLFALKCIAEKKAIRVPAFFESEPWRQLNHTILSTSNCGNPALRLFGFGPVVQDGFGIGYIIKDSGLQYSVSSKHRQTERFVNTLHQTLLDLEKLMKPSSSVEVEQHRRRVPAEKNPSLVEYMDGFGGIWGETGSQHSKLPSENDKSTRYFARVFQRSTSLIGDELLKVGKNVDDAEK